MRFTIDEGLFGLFPALRVGFVVCDIDNIRYGEDGLEDIVDDLRVHFSFERPQDHPNIKAWREAFRKLGISSTKYPTPLEILLKQALKGGPFPRFNPIIDLYNAASLKYLVPITGHSLSTIDRRIELRFAEGGELFIPIDMGKQETVDKGEAIYRDARDALTRRWIWKQANKDRIGSQTTKVLLLVHIMDGLPVWLCDQVMNYLVTSIAVNGYGKITHQDILTSSKRETELII